MNDTPHLLRTLKSGVLTVTLNRPRVRNAMNFATVEELFATVEEAPSSGVRAMVLRGAGGHFCAGGDLAEMAGVRARQPTEERDPLAVANRRYGALLQAVDTAPFAVLAFCEGAVMGGGFGLACAADITIAAPSVRFRLPEARIGLTPAMVTPFLVRRVGIGTGRRLAVTGATLGAAEALAVGLAHHAPSDPEAVLASELALIRRCAPGALAASKALVNLSGAVDLDTWLDEASTGFAAAARGAEAQAGFAAFLSKTPPPWESP